MLGGRVSNPVVFARLGGFPQKMDTSDSLDSILSESLIAKWLKTGWQVSESLIATLPPTSESLIANTEISIFRPVKHSIGAGPPSEALIATCTLSRINHP